ncbi:MAG: hypothetical protein FWD53_06910 [Phycisphaerales bacterium]|nr:hypothetical protein [Phycisphaerales bacterium]
MIESLNSKSVNSEQLIAFWRSNPVQASKDIFNVDLDTHQRMALNQMWFNNSQTNIMSRGTGKTFMNGLGASLEGILKPGYRVGLLAPSYRQSKMIWAEVEKLYEQSPIFQESCVRPPAITPEKCYVKFRSAPGKVGSVIEALPMGTDGGKIRGARYFSTYIDEAAHIQKSILDVVIRGFMATSANPMEKVKMIREMEAMVQAGLMTREQMLNPPANKMVFSTTAYFQYNHAWERVSKLISEIKLDYKRAQKAGEDLSRFQFIGGPLNADQIPHRILSDGKRGLACFTCMDPSRGFMNMESIKEAKREMSDYAFRMEYFGYFPPDSEGFFRRSLLDKCRTHGEFGPILEPRTGLMYTMGVDPARSGDNFAIAIFEIDTDNEIVRLIRVLSWNKKEFPLMHRHVRSLLRQYNMTYFQMDAGGGGTTIRDLLANKENCPVGERLILEQEFDEHKTKLGDRYLGKLIQFSSYDWVHDANHNLLSGLQHGRLQIAAKPPIPGQIWTPAMEDADEEMERALTEWSSIVMHPVGSRMRWDSPAENMRKDRYSAILIGYDAARKVLANKKRPKKLAFGFWA